jgi:DNA-binding FadR family transcriptional regulator
MTHKTSTFKPIRRPLLSEEVGQQIRQAILTGAYKLGDRLPSERELSKQLNVSRATVREALRQLQTNGLILIKRGVDAGAYVSELRPDPIIENFNNLMMLGKVNFAHFMHARLYIEPPTAKVAAVIRTRKDVEKLSTLLEEAERIVNSSPRKARLICTRFHCEVASILKNPIIDFICASITVNYSSALIEMSKAKLGKKEIFGLIRKHSDILDSIIARKPEKAFEKARNHILETYKMYSQIFPAEDVTNIEECMRLSNTTDSQRVIESDASVLSDLTIVSE